MTSKLRYTFTGVIVPVFTPFKDDSERTLNTQIIPKYADYLKSKNVKGILVNGTVAEGMTMSVQERKQLAETWSQAAKKNNQHLVIQVGGTRLADVKDLAKHAQTVNADAILCLPEIYYRTSTMDELIDYMKEVSDAAPKTPLLFYHNPKRSNVTLQIGKFMEKAGKMIPTLVGLKFVGYDFEEGVDSLHENDQFVHILSAEKIIPSACVAGIDTFMIISSNLFPEMVQSMIDCCTKNDYIKAKETQKKLLWSVNQMTQLGHSFASIKAFMPLFTGIDVGPSRKPIPSYITDSDKEKILRIFDKISNEFKNYKYM